MDWAAVWFEVIRQIRHLPAAQRRPQSGGECSCHDGHGLADLAHITAERYGPPSHSALSPAFAPGSPSMRRRVLADFPVLAQSQRELTSAGADDASTLVESNPSHTISGPRSRS